MDKPYSLEKLKEKLVAQGLPLVEDMAEKSYKAVKEWASESAAETKTPIDDVVTGFFPQLDKFVEPQLNKIDQDDEH